MTAAWIPCPCWISADQVSLGGEQGLLGLAFSPDGRHLYVNYTDTNGDTHVTGYAMGDRQADAATRRDVLVVDQPYANHNGGNLAFGPDGYLYIGLGDGGSGGDPEGNGQSLSTLLGKMLRIDPDALRRFARTGFPRTTRSSAAPTHDRRSGPTACATRGGTRSTERPATCGSGTSARARGRRWTSSHQPPREERTTAGT